MTLTTQILFNKRSAFLERHVGFWRTDDVQLKNVDHTFIQIQLDRLTSGIQRLILTNKIAKKDLLGASYWDRKSNRLCVSIPPLRGPDQGPAELRARRDGGL